MEKFIIIAAFLLIRYLLKSNSDKTKQKKSAPKKVAAPTPQPVTSPKPANKNLDDIFGDFLKEIKKDATPEPKPLMKTAETKQKLDWQEVVTSKNKNISTDYVKPKSKIRTEEMEVMPIEDTHSTILDDFDLKKAVLYKEILERKYFTI